MKNYKLQKIGNVFTVSSGGTPIRNKPEYYINGNIPWVKTGDLKGKYVNKPDEFITEEALKNSSAKLFPEKTVLLAMYGATIGACSILPFEAATNQACAALLPSKNCDEIYLFYYLKSILEELIKMGVGGAQPNISAGKIKQIEIPIPPLSTQKKIAAILDAADAYRQKTKNLIDKYDQLAQTLFLDMFGDPVRNEKGWKVNDLKSISTKILSGNTPKGGREVYVNEGIIFFRSQNVWRNRIVLEDVAFIDQDTHDKMRNSSLKHRDILMTKTGRFNTENSSLGRAAMFLGDNDTANLNGHVYLIRLKNGIVNEFVLFIITTNQYREHIRRVCVGGIDKRQINKEHLEEFPIISPPIELQQKFTNILLSIEEQKQQAQASLQKAEDLFNSLLQRAFKGELI
jgi:type I restriction enzyme S subunit